VTRVIVPSQLRGYTSGATEVSADGGTLDAVLRDLDRQFPGIRFRVIDEQDRVRQHIIIFVAGERTDSIATSIGPGAEVQIVGALSGG
jgi:molybdopterin converting factor small subunit